MPPARRGWSPPRNRSSVRWACAASRPVRGRSCAGPSGAAGGPDGRTAARGPQAAKHARYVCEAVAPISAAPCRPGSPPGSAISRTYSGTSTTRSEPPTWLRDAAADPDDPAAAFAAGLLAGGFPPTTPRQRRLVAPALAPRAASRPTSLTSGRQWGVALRRHVRVEVEPGVRPSSTPSDRPSRPTDDAMVAETHAAAVARRTGVRPLVLPAVLRPLRRHAPGRVPRPPRPGSQRRRTTIRGLVPRHVGRRRRPACDALGIEARSCSATRSAGSSRRTTRRVIPDHPVEAGAVEHRRPAATSTSPRPGSRRSAVPEAARSLPAGLRRRSRRRGRRRVFPALHAALQPDSVAVRARTRSILNFAMLADSTRWFVDYDQRDDLAAIRAPTLVLAGEDDPMTPVEAAEEIVALLPPASAASSGSPTAATGPIGTSPRPPSVCA